MRIENTSVAKDTRWEARRDRKLKNKLFKGRKEINQASECVQQELDKGYCASSMLMRSGRERDGKN